MANDSLAGEGADWGISGALTSRGKAPPAELNQRSHPRRANERRNHPHRSHFAAASRGRRGVIEGGGSYNLHAKIPAGGGNLALPYLEKTARSCTLRSGSDPIVIAD
jgi:hypothetical protein